MFCDQNKWCHVVNCNSLSSYLYHVDVSVLKVIAIAYINLIAFPCVVAWDMSN